MQTLECLYAGNHVLPVVMTEIQIYERRDMTQACLCLKKVYKNDQKKERLTSYK